MEALIPNLKKQIRTYFVIALGTLGLICASNTYAGQVLEHAVVGPGLGDAEFEPTDEVPYPDEFYYGKEFESIEYIDLLMLVGDSPPNGNSNTHPVTIYEDIYNATGSEWIDYHLELGFVDLGDCDSPDCDYEFTSVVSELAFIEDLLDQDTFGIETFMPEENPNKIWFEGGTVDNGDDFYIDLVFDLPDYADVSDLATLYTLGLEGLCDGEDANCYVIALRQFPSIADVTPPNPVPVPAAFWLFGTALIGFIGVSRRRKVA